MLNQKVRGTLGLLALFLGLAGGCETLFWRPAREAEDQLAQQRILAELKVDLLGEVDEEEPPEAQEEEEQPPAQEIEGEANREDVSLPGSRVPRDVPEPVSQPLPVFDNQGNDWKTIWLPAFLNLGSDIASMVLGSLFLKSVTEIHLRSENPSKENNL